MLTAVVGAAITGPATINVRMLPTGDLDDVSNMTSCRYGVDGDRIDHVCQVFGLGTEVPERFAEIGEDTFTVTLPLRLADGEVIVDFDVNDPGDDRPVEVLFVTLVNGDEGASYVVPMEAVADAWEASLASE